MSDILRRNTMLGSPSSNNGGGGSDEGTIDINNYLTIEALENGLTAKLSTNACEYCINGDGVWKTLTANTTTPSINQGQVISFRGNLTPSKYVGIGTFTISKKCNLKGNCMSMLFGDDAENNYSLSGNGYAFYELFYNCYYIIEVSPNFLSATTLAEYCYCYMFRGCTSLTTAPELPATTLTNYCYNYMFQGCTRLTTAPELPATTLANDCYAYMFQGCASLVTPPPILPATTLAKYCYQCMFRNCTSLTTAPELPATTLAKYCYAYMFYDCSKLNYIKAMFTTTPSSSYTNSWVYGVSSTGTFIKNKDATWNVTGNDGIPSGWTVIEEDPS